MNINLVCHNYDNSDKILPRLARVLSESGGWQVSGSPSPHVDLNHFVCYIDYSDTFHPWHKTPTTAWFTHYEKGEPDKERWWKLAAENVDVRSTSARRYVEPLAKFGETVLITPPLDTAMFALDMRSTMSTKPIVGLSGFVNTYTDRRKGMHLVRQLIEHPINRHIKLIATGEGWKPVPTQRRALHDLPKFYKRIDVLLCTALIEGIPMPPLEALATGRPVVIPENVGLLDDLPEMEGIYRYPKGDFAAMVDALERAMRGDHEPAALRETVMDYTAEAWALGHSRMFENLLFRSKSPGELKTDSKRGVYYVAYGSPARKCVKKSIASLREHMPGVPCAVASEKPVESADVFIDNSDDDIGGRSVKTRIYELAPQDWQRVLYLDADTELIADVSFLFDVLADGWDMVICTNPSRFYSTRHMVRPDNKVECEETYKVLGTDDAIQYNGGVFAFQRNERTAAFFSEWHTEWQRWGKRDQAALLRALWKYPVRLYILGGAWNTILNEDLTPRYNDTLENCAGILHFPMTARRHIGIIQGRLDSKEAWDAIRR